MKLSSAELSLQIQTACVLEASARKLGNVHPLASFPDLCYADFVIAAEAVAPVLARSREMGVGRAVLDAVEATRTRTGKNVNLGIILLLAPLAAVPPDVSLREGICEVLAPLTNDDARLVYQAIRLAQPGGLGRVDREDVSGEPTGTLLDVMYLAVDRDLIAKQYVTEFSLVLDEGVSFLQLAAAKFRSQWEDVIIGLQVTVLAKFQDSLIVRKCGSIIAAEAACRAEHCRDGLLRKTPPPGSLPRMTSLYSALGSHLAYFDAWLRADGHCRNPGTTADLIAACLFAAFRDGVVPMPSLEDIQNELRLWGPNNP